MIKYNLKKNNNRKSDYLSRRNKGNKGNFCHFRDFRGT